MSVGKIFKFHNDLDTDQIIASQYLLLPTIDEMKDHTFESLDPDFPKKVKPGDYVVGGENFGCGSSKGAGCSGRGCQILCPHLLPQCHQHWPSGYCLQRPAGRSKYRG